MSTPSNAIVYQPPAFRVYEADAIDAGGEVNRWLQGWNGPVGESAIDVTLGMAAPAVRALVTSSEWESEFHSRVAAGIIAAHLAGPPPDIDVARPVDEALDDSVWGLSSLMVDDRKTAVRSGALFGVKVAYTVERGSGFAAAWCGEIKIRRVVAHTARGYTTDPLTPHSYRDLENRPLPGVH